MKRMIFLASAMIAVAMNSVIANDQMDKVIQLDEAIEVAIKNLEIELEEQNSILLTESLIPLEVIIVNEKGDRLYTGTYQEAGNMVSNLNENNLLLEVGGIKYFLKEKN